MQGLIGLIGVLLTFAGIHLLWRARHEIIYWVDRLLLIFRRSFDEAARTADVPRDDGSGGATAVSLSSQRHGHQILVLLGGVGLIALGQFLLMIYVASLLI